jgi:hypothetical protein
MYYGVAYYGDTNCNAFEPATITEKERVYDNITSLLLGSGIMQIVFWVTDEWLLFFAFDNRSFNLLCFLLIRVLMTMGVLVPSSLAIDNSRYPSTALCPASSSVVSWVCGFNIAVHSLMLLMQCYIYSVIDKMLTDERNTQSLDHDRHADIDTHSQKIHADSILPPPPSQLMETESAKLIQPTLNPLSRIPFFYTAKSTEMPPLAVRSIAKN